MDLPHDDAGSKLHNGEFTDGDASQGIEASIDKGKHMTALYKELIAIIVAGGLTPNVNDLTQVLTALQAMFGISVHLDAFSPDGYIDLPGNMRVMFGTGPGEAGTGAHVSGKIDFPTPFAQLRTVIPWLHTNAASTDAASINIHTLTEAHFSFNLHRAQAHGNYTIKYLAIGTRPAS